MGATKERQAIQAQKTPVDAEMVRCAWKRNAVAKRTAAKNAVYVVSHLLFNNGSQVVGIGRMIFVAQTSTRSSCPPRTPSP